jgi:hypothetical protein
VYSGDGLSWLSVFKEMGFFSSIKKALTKKEIKKKNKVFHFLKQESQINGNGN